MMYGSALAKQMSIERAVFAGIRRPPGVESSFHCISEINQYLIGLKLATEDYERFDISDYLSPIQKPSLDPLSINRQVEKVMNGE